jgi:hypothetical protein
MKTYIDFISDMVDDPALFDEINKAAPFADASELRSWFAERCYELTDADCQTLLTHQSLAADPDEEFQY